jgi:hypothetical protein
MRAIPTAIPDVIALYPKVFGEALGATDVHRFTKDYLLSDGFK